jgi:hypothetical protein
MMKEGNQVRLIIDTYNGAGLIGHADFGTAITNRTMAMSDEIAPILSKYGHAKAILILDANECVEAEASGKGIDLKAMSMAMLGWAIVHTNGGQKIDFIEETKKQFPHATSDQVNEAVAHARELHELCRKEIVSLIDAHVPF